MFEKQRKTLSSVTVLTVLAFSSISYAEPNKVVSEVKNHLDKLVWQFGEQNTQWSYKVESNLHTLHGDYHRLQQFDAAAPAEKQWTLLEQEHKPPTAEVLAEYTNMQKANADPDRDSVKIEGLNTVSDGDTFMDQQSLEQIGEEQDWYVLAFQPKLGMFDAKINRKLKGKLFIDKTNYQVLKLEIVNSNKISPSMGSTIKAMLLRVTFKLHESGYTVPQEWTYDTKGTAFVFSDFAEKNVKIYSDITKKAG